MVHKPDSPMFEPDAWNLSEQERNLSSLARDIGQNKIADRAAEYDRNAAFPVDNYRDMHDAGLMGICIPKEYGGFGLDLRGYAVVAAEIGRYCGSTALTWNMHVCSCLWSGALTDGLDMDEADRKRHRMNRAVHYRRILDEGAIYSQPFSEGGAAAAGAAAFGTTALKAPGGWWVNGKKIFASLAGNADY